LSTPGKNVQILLINQFFWPDLAATSQLPTDLVGPIADQGHDVTVSCARHPYAGADCARRPPERIVRVPDLPFARGGPRLEEMSEAHVGLVARTGAGMGSVVPGARARDAFVAHYDKPAGVQRVCNVPGRTPAV
jgi:hypothetical protein